LRASLVDLDNENNLANLIWKERDNYVQRGASWNGDAIWPAVFIVGWVVLLSVLIYFTVINPKLYHCTAYGEYSCSTQEECIDESSSTDYDGNTTYSCNEYGPVETCGSPCIEGYYSRN
jgi:hypothetical protein